MCHEGEGLKSPLEPMTTPATVWTCFGGYSGYMAVDTNPDLPSAWGLHRNSLLVNKMPRTKAAVPPQTTMEAITASDQEVHSMCFPETSSSHWKQKTRSFVSMSSNISTERSGNIGSRQWGGRSSWTQISGENHDLSQTDFCLRDRTEEKGRAAAKCQVIITWVWRALREVNKGHITVCVCPCFVAHWRHCPLQL